MQTTQFATQSTIPQPIIPPTQQPQITRQKVASKSYQILRANLNIEPYMIDLDLPKVELLCYAMIANFNQQNKLPFYGTQGYLAAQIGKSRQAVQKAVVNLIHKQHLQITYTTDNKALYTAIFCPIGTQTGKSVTEYDCLVATDSPNVYTTTSFTKTTTTFSIPSTTPTEIPDNNELGFHSVDELQDTQNPLNQIPNDTPSLDDPMFDIDQEAFDPNNTPFTQKYTSNAPDCTQEANPPPNTEYTQYPDYLQNYDNQNPEYANTTNYADYPDYTQYSNYTQNPDYPQNPEYANTTIYADYPDYTQYPNYTQIQETHPFNIALNDLSNDPNNPLNLDDDNYLSSGNYFNTDMQKEYLDIIYTQLTPCEKEKQQEAYRLCTVLHNLIQKQISQKTAQIHNNHIKATHPTYNQ